MPSLLTLAGNPFSLSIGTGYTFDPHNDTLPLFKHYQIVTLANTAIFSGCSPAQITDIKPDTVNGGVGDTVRIIGSHFGITQGQLYLSNADDGAGTLIALDDYDYIPNGWTDTMITFIVPNIIDSVITSNSQFGTPGSGAIAVMTSTGDSAIGHLEIFCTINNIVYDTTNYYQKKKIVTADFTLSHIGGYGISLDSSFTNHVDRSQCIHKAIKDWVCLTNI